MIDTEHLRGELVIDYGRGVIYFHTSNPRVADRFGTATPLRICGLPDNSNPLPRNTQIDLTLHATGWLVTRTTTPPTPSST